MLFSTRPHNMLAILCFSLYQAVSLYQTTLCWPHYDGGSMFVCTRPHCVGHIMFLCIKSHYVGCSMFLSTRPHNMLATSCFSVSDDILWPTLIFPVPGYIMLATLYTFLCIRSHYVGCSMFLYQAT